MLTATEIEEWEMVVKEPPLSFAWEEIAVGLRKRLIQAEQERNELLEALRAAHDVLLMNPRFRGGRAHKMVTAALDKVEGKR